MKKPEPQIFQKALDNLNVLPSESIFVGDHPEKDVQASQDIGMKGVWKKDYQWDNVKADFIVEDLKEISLIVEKLNNQNLLS
jgi:putative hydrolase of the HAD superfamily